MHEHVFVISPEMKDNVPEEWGDEDHRMDDAARRLQELKESGIDAILDPTALGLGRYIPRIGQLAQRIDLKIIVATGLYTFNELPHYWSARVPGSGPDGSDPMVNLFVRDITEGIAGTCIKAGVISAPPTAPGSPRRRARCGRVRRHTGRPGRRSPPTPMPRPVAVWSSRRSSGRRGST
jgi:phosphotriesterase-related protein